MTITFPELTETEGKLSAKRKELHDLFAEAKNEQGELDATKVKGYSSGTELAEAVRAMNDEIDDLAKKAEEQRAIFKAAQNGDDFEAEAGDGGAGSPGPQRTKGFGQLFTESVAYKQKGAVSEIEVDLKTLFQTSAGWAPFVERGPRVVDFATRPIEMLDLIPTTPTNQTSIVYMEETTYTNTAAETAEGGTKPEATLALTERTSPVRKIPVWIPVTDEQLEDVEGVQSYLERRLGFMVRQRLSGQIISGDGTAPNLRGVLNVAGIQTQAKGTDPVPDAIYKAMTKVEVTGQAMPDAAVFHPNDWQDVRLLRTADGIYIWGNPSEAGPERIWGLRVVKVQAATENTAVVGDWANFSELRVKKDVEIKISDSHGTFFVENKQAVRAEMRAAVVFYRPAAFCTVTGI